MENSSAGDDRLVKMLPYADDIMGAVEERNATVEKDPVWIDSAYTGIKLRKLNSLPQERYSYYSKFVENESAYIIVHPAYYVFFHNKKPLVQRVEGNNRFNIVDLFLDSAFENPVVRLMQEQQRNEKNFIEYMTTKGNLVILILPRDYINHQSYGYGLESDEYARYINEIANESESVIYMESNAPTSGKLEPSDLVMLFSFLTKINANSILVGGGYVGRCQGEFYNYVSSYSPAGNYFIVPEISVFSPEDISEDNAASLLNTDTINMQAASKYIVYRMSGRPNLQHLSSLKNNSLLHADLQEINKKTSPAGQ